MRRHALFVLGMHRSGTSALTGAIAKAGANPGATLMPATDDNPEGYWEDARLVGFNDQLLRNLGSRWDSVAPLPEGWSKLPVALSARAQAAELIAQEWGEATLAVVKDPRLCRLLRLWRDAFTDAGFNVSCVLMTRRPIDVAASLARRDRFGPEKSLALWLAHLIDAERESRDIARAFVTYEQLLADPAGSFERVCTDAAFPLAPPPVQQQAALAVVRPELNRQGSRASDGPRASMASSLEAVLDAGYAVLAALGPRTDPKSAIETLALDAAGALATALPPWIAHELDSAQALASALADDLAGARGTIVTLEEEIAAARAAHASRDAIESSLRSKLASAPVTAADFATFERALRDEIAPLAGALATAQQALATASAAERAARETLGQAQRDLVGERATIAALRAQIDSARAAAQDFESQIDMARRHIEELVRRDDEARRAHAARDEIEGLLTRERDSLREELARVGRDLPMREGEIAALAQQLRTMELALAAVNTELERRAGAEQTLVSDRNALASLEREARERAARLEHELAASVADARAARTGLDSATAEIARLRSRWLERVARRLARR